MKLKLIRKINVHMYNTATPPTRTTRRKLVKLVFKQKFVLKYKIYINT